MEVFTLSLERFRYIRKHRKNLERRFHLKIFLPEEYNLTCTIANVSGEKRNIRQLKDYLNVKVEENIDNPSTSNSSTSNSSTSNSSTSNSSTSNLSTSNDVPLITLSDSDSEIKGPHETPIKEKKKKRKFDSFNCSTPLTAEKLAPPGNSSEVKVLADKTAPISKRARSGPSFPSEEFIPLSVTKNIKGARSVKIKLKKKSSLNAVNQEKSTSSCVESTSAVSSTLNTCETDVTSAQDESVRIIEDTFVLNNKQSSSSTKPCETDTIFNLDDSVMVVEDSSRMADDSIRVIEDCFVLDRRPSFPKENDTVELDDSIVEIAVLEGGNHQISQEKTPFQLAQVLTNPSTNRHSTARNNFPSLATIFHDRNSFQQLLVTNYNEINIGLPNVASGSTIVPNGLVAQVPWPTTSRLRPVVIDGSNVARDHGLATQTYSCRGIKISVDYFLMRGHTEITVFVPKFRKHRLHGQFPTTDVNLLEELEKAGRIAYSPSRIVDGKKQSCYDDRMVVQLATQNGGVILSNDNFRDIMVEKKEFKKTITERLLMFCFAGDTIMIPDDPLGRDGPRLDEFLAFPAE